MTDKERLENINPIGVDRFGNILLKGDDYHWLMEQAEKVQELQEENKRYHETLKYYADEKHYEPYCIDGYGCDVTEDGGEIARQALEVQNESN